MRFAALFLWLALPLGVYGTYALYGLPHMIWNFRFYDNGAPNDPFAKREYIDCTFWGPYGRITVPAEAGHCPWVRFFKPDSAQ